MILNILLLIPAILKLLLLGTGSMFTFIKNIACFKNVFILIPTLFAAIFFLSPHIVQASHQWICEMKLYTSGVCTPAAFSTVLTCSLGNNSCEPLCDDPSTCVFEDRVAIDGSLSHRFFSCVTDPFCGHAPNANAGPDQVLEDLDANGVEKVTLTALGSTDFDGFADIVSFVWKEGAVVIASGANPTISLAVGEHTIVLTVKDTTGLSDTDTVVITIVGICPLEDGGGGLVPCGRICDDPSTLEINEATSCTFCHLFYLINRIVTFLFTQFLPVLALLFITLSGMLILTSRGNAHQFSMGKQMLLWTLIGLAVLVAGWVLFNSFFTYTGAKKWTGLTGEEGTITAVSGSTFTVTVDDPWDANEWVGLGFTITTSSNEDIIGMSRTVTSNSPTTATTESWGFDTPLVGDMFRIGGWWQFACGVNFGLTVPVVICGGDGQECCGGIGGTCFGGLTCDGSGICVLPPPPPPCGGVGEVCCATGPSCDLAGLACNPGTNQCEVCGGATQICCTSPSVDPCGAGLTCTGGTCTPLPPLPCAPPNTCVLEFTCTTTVTADTCPSPLDECCEPVPPLPPTVSLTASPNPIEEGNPTTLTWIVTNADTCTASSVPFHAGWDGPKDEAGASQPITPLTVGTHTYSITCTNVSGSDTASVDVLVETAPLPIFTLNVSDTAITNGQSVTLDWVITDADTCSASGAWTGTKYSAGACLPPSCSESSGSLVGPASYTFTLTCFKGVASASDSKTVTVTGDVPAPSAHWPFTDLDISRRIRDWNVGAQHGWYKGEVWRDATLGDGGCVPGVGVCPAIVSGPVGGYGQAFKFDDIDDYVEVANTLGAFNLTSGWSVSAWVKPEVAGSDAVSDPIVWKVANNGGHEDTFYVGWGDPIDGNVFKAGLERAADDVDFAVKSAVHPANQWYRVIAVFDGSNLSLYVYDETGSGALEGTMSIGGGAVAYTGPAPLRIGNNMNSSHAGAGTFNGRIDEVRIYNVPFVPAEANVEKSARYPVIPSVASWSFESIDGSKTHDTHHLVKGQYGGAGRFHTRDDNGDAVVDLFDGTPTDVTEFDFVVIGEEDASGNLTINPMSMPTGEVSVGFWMKSSDAGVCTIPGGAKCGTPFSYAVLGSDNEFLIYDYNNFYISANTAGGFLTGVPGNDGMWHHIVVTWRASDGEVRIYKDGSLAVGPGTISDIPITTGGVLVFGQEQELPGDAFDILQSFLGEIDDMKVWNQVLTATEVSAEFTAGP